MKEKYMSQKYEWKIWVQNVGIKKIVKNVSKGMWDKNVGVEKCE